MKISIPDGMRRPRRLVVAALVVATIVTGVVLWQGRALPDSVAYALDGDEVSASDLEEQARTLEALYGVSAPEDADEAEAYWRDSAQAAVMAELLDAAAVDSGVEVSQDEVDAALAQYVSALYDGAPDANQQFVTALGNAGTSQRAVETEIRRRLTTERLITEVVGDVEVPTAEQAQAAFVDRKCSLDLPETRTLRNIVSATEAEATAVASELAAGADFATLAATRSADASSRENGGDIGTLAARQLEAGYAEVAFAAPVGQVFGPVETASGWNVGVVTAVLPGRTVDYAEVAEPFANLLLMEAQSAAWRDWLAGLLEDADVEYSDRFRPEDPSALPSGVAQWSQETGFCPGGGEAS